MLLFLFLFFACTDIKEITYGKDGRTLSLVRDDNEKKQKILYYEYEYESFPVETIDSEKVISVRPIRANGFIHTITFKETEKEVLKETQASSAILQGKHILKYRLNDKKILIGMEDKKLE